jgi:hypothetical protein
LSRALEFKAPDCYRKSAIPKLKMVVCGGKPGGMLALPVSATCNHCPHWVPDVPRDDDEGWGSLFAMPVSEI